MSNHNRFTGSDYDNIHFVAFDPDGDAKEYYGLDEFISEHPKFRRSYIKHIVRYGRPYENRISHMAYGYYFIELDENTHYLGGFESDYKEQEEPLRLPMWGRLYSKS